MRYPVVFRSLRDGDDVNGEYVIDRVCFVEDSALAVDFEAAGEIRREVTMRRCSSCLEEQVTTLGVGECWLAFVFPT